jgi:hypothetical protein
LHEWIVNESQTACVRESRRPQNLALFGERAEDRDRIETFETNATIFSDRFETFKTVGLIEALLRDLSGFTVGSERKR